MKKYSFVSIGPGGWTLYEKSIKTNHGSSKSKLQGLLSHPLENHMHEIEEGSLVLDTRPCQTRALGMGRVVWQYWVENELRSPLVDVDLSEDIVDRLEAKGSTMHSVDAFAVMLAIHQDQKDKGEIGSLDCVSPELYCAWWKERGAYVGYIKDGEIVWPEENWI